MFNSFGGLLPTSLPTNRGLASDSPESVFLSRYRQKWPHATDDLSLGIYRSPRDLALTKRYIQTTPRPLHYCLVLDIDHSDALLRAFRPDLPRPSWVAQSPSGRAHAGYLLANPFSSDDPQQQKAARLASRIEAGLRQQLDADPGYSGLMTKNPLHSSWETKWGTSALHTLAQMAQDLGSNLGAVPSRKYRGDVAGLGRNCQLFEKTRLWSYSAVRRYWEDGPEAFHLAVRDHVTVLNSQLPVPLDVAEAHGIASSIARWTWATMTPEKFREVQQKRSAKGNQTKTARALQREQTVLKMRAEGMKWQTIADTLGMSLDAAKSIGRRAQQRSEKSVTPLIR